MRLLQQTCRLLCVWCSPIYFWMTKTTPPEESINISTSRPSQYETSEFHCFKSILRSRNPSSILGNHPTHSILSLPLLVAISVSFISSVTHSGVQWQKTRMCQRRRCWLVPLSIVRNRRASDRPSLVNIHRAVRRAQVCSIRLASLVLDGHIECAAAPSDITIYISWFMPRRLEGTLYVIISCDKYASLIIYDTDVWSHTSPWRLPSTR